MSNTELWLEEWVENDGYLTVGASIEQSGAPRRHLWYRVPADMRPAITPSADPFVAGVLFDAMLVGGRLTVHGDVSPSLLRNIEEFQMAWEKWRPTTYQRVEIVPDRSIEATATETTAAVMMFSGGVDSSFTAWRHRVSGAGPQQCDPQAGIFVHGFDIPLDRQADFDGATERAEKMLTSIDMDLIRLTTNFRSLNGDWDDTHGAGLASCLMLFQRGYCQGLIASSFAYSYLALPYGSNPLTDGMFSSATFPIIHDGAGFDRLQKTQVVAQWPEVAKYLRVCWKNHRLDRNCCRCQKCVSNIFFFRAVGLAHMECFERDITNREIVRLYYPRPEMVRSMERILRVAIDLHITDSWVRALKCSVFLNRINMRIQQCVRTLWHSIRGR